MSQPARDGGYTLVELLVTIAILGALLAIAVSGWAGWARASEQSGTARELQSLMRRTQQTAVTEGRAMCVQFDAPGNRWSVYRGACQDTTRVEVQPPSRPEGRGVRLAAPDFTGTTATTGVTFFARGTATPGHVKVTRAGSAKVYTLTVEGLTGRVSLA